MNIVELFSGSSNFSNEMRKRGHHVIDIDINKNTSALIHTDISKLSFSDLENLFPNKKIDFIMAAPNVICYLTPIRNTIEKSMWVNILNKCNCKFIVEMIALAKTKDYRKNNKIFYLNYKDFNNKNFEVPISTNCDNLEKYIIEHLDTQYSYEGFKEYLGATPFKLVKIICDYIEDSIKE